MKQAVLFMVTVALVCGNSPAAAPNIGIVPEKSISHFRADKNGGTIELEAKDPSDTPTIGQIRAQIERIVQMFRDGNFEAPGMAHQADTPGVADMKRLVSDIRYNYESTPRGAQVRILAATAEARSAVHEFLKYQIRKHKRIGWVMH